MYDNTIYLGFEGMPRSGKSTTFEKIAKKYKDVIKISEEIFYDDEYRKTMKDPRGDLSTSLWFLDQEAKRLSNYLKANQKQLFLSDRTYLSTLAYAYARAKTNSNPAEFEKLVAYFQRHLQSYPQYKFIFIFDTPPNITFERRKSKKIKENEYWMNKVFMDHYRNFYLNEAQKYTNAKIIYLNSLKMTLTKMFESINKVIGSLINPKISVVICVHNDPDGLTTTAESLTKQSLKAEEFEIVVVDNASAPTLESTVKKLSSETPLVVHYVAEPQLGLGNARNTGINLSHSDQIAITDADNIASQNWLSSIIVTFKSTNALVVGGKVDNKFDGSLPSYFPSELTEYFSPTSWPKNLIPVKPPYFVIGANLAFKKSVALEVGGFNPSLGRIGNKLLSCEDIEFTIKVQIKHGSGRIYIDPKATVTHITSAKMCRFPKLMQRAFWQGVSESKLIDTVGKKYVYNQRSALNFIKHLCLVLLSSVTLNMKMTVFHLFQATANYGYLYQKITRAN